MTNKKENEEKKDLTGLKDTPIAEQGYNAKDSEYNLTTALLEAADFRNDEDSITPIEIRRNGKYLFTFNIHPISDSDARRARKKATKYMPNPNGRKLPPIEKEFDSALFHSHLIYMATIEEDQQKIWNNTAVKQKHEIMDPVDSIDVLLKVGEKLEVVDAIMDISGMGGEDDASIEEYAKN